MKKKIIIGLAMVSALSFGATNNNVSNKQMAYNNTNQSQIMNHNNGEQMGRGNKGHKGGMMGSKGHMSSNMNKGKMNDFNQNMNSITRVSRR